MHCYAKRLNCRKRIKPNWCNRSSISERNILVLGCHRRRACRRACAAPRSHAQSACERYAALVALLPTNPPTDKCRIGAHHDAQLSTALDSVIKLINDLQTREDCCAHVSTAIIGLPLRQKPNKIGHNSHLAASFPQSFNKTHSASPAGGSRLQRRAADKELGSGRFFRRNPDGNFVLSSRDANRGLDDARLY
jgi:hypothetical protein